jgi:hypothetical protein
MVMIIFAAQITANKLVRKKTKNNKACCACALYLKSSFIIWGFVSFGEIALLLLRLLSTTTIMTADCYYFNMEGPPAGRESRGKCCKSVGPVSTVSVPGCAQLILNDNDDDDDGNQQRPQG